MDIPCFNYHDKILQVYRDILHNYIYVNCYIHYQVFGITVLSIENARYVQL